jgi:hypothetical protein
MRSSSEQFEIFLQQRIKIVEKYNVIDSVTLTVQDICYSNNIEPSFIYDALITRFPNFLNLYPINGLKIVKKKAIVKVLTTEKNSDPIDYLIELN